MSDMKGVCGRCADEASLTCGGCHNIKYCSIECQETDWRVHKTLCKKYQDSKTKPSPEFRRAIFLPSTRKDPRSVWVEVGNSFADGIHDDASDSGEFDEDVGVPQYDSQCGSALSDFKPLFGNSYPRTLELVLGKFNSGERLEHGLHLAHVVSPFQPPNECVNHLTQSNLGFFYNGSLVIYAMTKVIESRFILDANASDLTLALDGLLEVRKRQEDPIGYITQPKRPKKILGVKYDVNEGILKDVPIPIRHPVFRKGSVCSVLKLIDSTIHTWQEKRPATTPALRSIPPTAYLQLNVRTAQRDESESGYSFGSVPEKWMSRSHAVLVAYANKQPLGSEVAGLMCQFCREIVAPMLETGPCEAATLSGNINRARFLEFVTDQLKEWSESKRRAFREKIQDFW